MMYFPKFFSIIVVHILLCTAVYAANNKITYADSSVYEGEFKDGKLEGKTFSSPTIGE